MISVFASFAQPQYIQLNVVVVLIAILLLHIGYFIVLKAIL